MVFRFPWRILPILLLLAILIFQSVGLATVAQSDARVALSSPDLSGFPNVIAYLDVRDAAGTFVENLTPEQVTVIEDGARRVVEKLQRHRAGAQFAVVVNPGRSLVLNDAEGFSRFDRLSDVVMAWAESGKASQEDDLSLFVAGGPVQSHLSVRRDWGDAFQGIEEFIQETSRSATPTLEVLAAGLDIAGDPPPRPGMGKAVLLITPPVEGDLSAGVQSLASRAQQENINVFVWYISSPDMLALPGAQQMQKLAALTGGQFFAFSGSEAVPDLEEYLEPLRSVYEIGFSSQSTSSGVHQLVVEVRLGPAEQENPLTATSLPQMFEVSVQPPSVTLVSPPSRIEREVDDHPDLGQSQESIVLTPLQETLDILIEFPDGYPRPVITSTLFVDDVPVVVNNQPPFDQINWDLRAITTSGSHSIRVEVVDSLGLSATTIEKTVDILVVLPENGLLRTAASNRLKFVALGALFIASVMALGFIAAGRLHPGRLGRGQKTGTATGKNQGLWARALITQAEFGLQEDEISRAAFKRLPQWMNRFQWPQRHKVAAVAYLKLIQENDENKAPAPVPMLQSEIVVGCDAERSQLVLDDPTVGAVHAIFRREKHSYRLVDMGTTAGTWLNYTPVSAEGVLVEHGDLVHIGRLGFRYVLKDTAHIKKPVVIREAQT